MDLTAASILLRHQQNFEYISPLAKGIVNLSGENYFLKKPFLNKSDKQFPIFTPDVAKAQDERKSYVVAQKKALEPSSFFTSCSYGNDENLSENKNFHVNKFFTNAYKLAQSIVIDERTNVVQSKHNENNDSLSIFNYNSDYVCPKIFRCNHEISFNDDADMLCLRSSCEAITTNNAQINRSTSVGNRIDSSQSTSRNSHDVPFSNNETVKNEDCNLVPFVKFRSTKNKYKKKDIKNSLAICEKQLFSIAEVNNRKCVHIPCTINILCDFTNSSDLGISQIYSTNLVASMLTNKCFTDGKINEAIVQNSLNQLISYIGNSINQIDMNEIFLTSGKYNRTAVACVNNRNNIRLNIQNCKYLFEKMIAMRLAGTKPNLSIIVKRESRKPVHCNLLAGSTNMRTGTQKQLTRSRRKLVDTNHILPCVTSPKCLKTKALLLNLNQSKSVKNARIIHQPILEKHSSSERMESPVLVTKEPLVEAEFQPSTFVGTVNIWAMVLMLKAMVCAFANIK